MISRSSLKLATPTTAGRVTQVFTERDVANTETLAPIELVPALHSKYYYDEQMAQYVKQGD